MKKFLALVLTLMMVFALAACGEKTPTSSGDGTSGGGTSQQTPAGGELYDIADSDIPVMTVLYPIEYTDDEAERAAVLDKIPAEIKKGIGTLRKSFISAYANKTVGLGDKGISFGAQFEVAGTDGYDTLKAYYKSLGGEVTNEGNVDAEQVFTMKFSWGEMTDCRYREDVLTDGTDIIFVDFTING